MEASLGNAAKDRPPDFIAEVGQSLVRADQKLGRGLPASRRAISAFQRRWRRSEFPHGPVEGHKAATMASGLG